MRGGSTKFKRLFALVAVLVCLIPGQASAQAPAPGSESLTVSPPTIELNGNPGQTVKQKITLDNGSSTARTVKVVVQNFGAAGETGSAELTDDDGPYSLKSWIKVSPSTVTIGPKDFKDFEISIAVPATPPPGGRFGAIVFEPTAAPGTPDEQVKVVSRVTSLLLLRLPGEATEKLGLETFTASPPGAKVDANNLPEQKTFYQEGPVNFHVRLKNEGNIQVKPKIETTVYNIFGAKIGTLAPTTEGNVLPDSIRRFDMEWKHSTLLGYYKAKTKVTYGSTPDTTQTIEGTTTFWGANVVLLGIIFVGLLGLFVFVWLPRKRWRKAFKALAAAGD